MAARSPPEDGIQAVVARMQQRKRAGEKRQDAIKTRVRWALGVFALVLVVALMADLKNMTRRMGDFRRTGKTSRKGDATDLSGGLDGPRYVDASGLFSLVPPRNWLPVRNPVEGFFNVVFQGPYGMDMGIQVVATNGLSFDQLVDNLRRVERSLAADTHMDFAYVGPTRAVKRSVQLYKSKVLLLDFVTGDLAHHVQFSMPPALYDEYEPVFMRLMQTYEPGQLLPPQTMTAGSPPSPGP